MIKTFNYDASSKLATVTFNANDLLSASEFARKIDHMHSDFLSHPVEKLLNMLEESPVGCSSALRWSNSWRDYNNPLMHQRMSIVVAYTAKNEMINAIKALREITNLGLKESKDIVQGPITSFIKNCNPAELSAIMGESLV